MQRRANICILFLVFCIRLISSMKLEQKSQSVKSVVEMISSIPLSDVESAISKYSNDIQKAGTILDKTFSNSISKNSWNNLKEKFVKIQSIYTIKSMECLLNDDLDQHMK